MVDTTGIGYGCAMLAVVCFGSNFVVTKAYKTGDGMFFQFVLCCGILTAGIIYQIALCSALGACPQFEPVAMLGGMIWCLGNSLTVSIIKTLGLGMGLLIWGLANMVTGWATGFFGMYGLTKNAVSQPALNCVGIGIAVLAMGIFSFVKPDLDAKAPSGEDEENGLFKAGSDVDETRAGLLAGEGGVKEADQGEEEISWTDKLTPTQKKLYGVGASMVAGLCYGHNFVPPQYIVDSVQTGSNEFPGAPTDLKDYVFPHFCGIWLTSLGLLLVYCLAKKGKPTVFPEVIAPGWLSGVIWATAQISWFFANQYLEVVVAFPLISIGPGLVGALWSVLVYKEITGRKNIIMLSLAFVVVGIAAALIVVSK